MAALTVEPCRTLHSEAQDLRTFYSFVSKMFQCDLRLVSVPVLSPVAGTVKGVARTVQ
jgi:hypothetical protein